MALPKGEERAVHLAREAVELVDAGHREVRDALGPSPHRNPTLTLPLLDLGRIAESTRGSLNCLRQPRGQGCLSQNPRRRAEWPSTTRPLPTLHHQ